MRSVVLRPRGSDPVLRISTRGLVFQNFKLGIYSRIGRARLSRLRRYFAVSRFALLTRFGEYLKTRFYYGFRLKKDRKKIAKLHGDIRKEKMKQIRQAREDRRLMKKAIQETKSKNRSKSGKKNVKVAKS